MKLPAGAAQRRIRSILAPFLQFRDEWLFHYPVYLNTFCFTYELAELLSQSKAIGSLDALGGNFRRHDWSTGLPKFTYRRDIELFVAVPSMIEQARLEGHNIPASSMVRFTRYDIKRVFVRRRRQPTVRSPQDWMLITDLPQNGPELVSSWKVKPPSWLRHLGKVDLNKLGNEKENMRLSNRRELSDLFEDHGKIYLFSAPLAYVLKRQSTKYVEKPANIKPIDTYFVLRCNSGVDPSKIRALRAAIRAYYRLIFTPQNTRRYLNPDAPRQYGRIASTVGQPQPFYEIHAPGVLTGADKASMLSRYATILLDHHRP